MRKIVIFDSCSHLHLSVLDKSDINATEPIIQLIAKLYELEKSFTADTTPTEIQAQRQKYATPIIDELFKWAKKQTILPQSDIGKAITYFLNHEKGLREYIKNGELLIDNNLIENKIRSLAIGRKNYMFVGNEQGAEQIAMFYAFFATDKMNDIEPYL